MSARTNRLGSSLSPYLLQHATNPVDWYPWGDEALERARREDKPILLSIGYAACHWCHVMEHESFEDQETAALMNERFVNIKVDREERPDLDQIYQLVVQLMGRSGGWPLTVFLAPDQRPFFAGTYFPPGPRHGMPSFQHVLRALSDAYRNERREVADQAAEITAAIGRVTGAAAGAEGEAGPEVLAQVTGKLLARFDHENGGFGSRPKFPGAMNLELLLRRGAVEGDAAAAKALRLALDHMRRGGIWDQLRGGFHRYSTDAAWLVPHFEKMLYDNALLLRLYGDAWRAFGDAACADTARGIVAYLFAEMRDPKTGAFFASQDADSEGHEGKFFVFSLGDLRAALGEGRAFDVARRFYGVTEGGNFEDTGASVLSEARPLGAVAAELGIPEAEASAALEEARGKLLAFRERRPRPLRDDKVLASWNGLAIGALAEAGRALGEASWVRAAEEAFAGLERGLVREGRVGRYLKDGVPASDRPGFLDDHAYLGNAALDLWEATGEPRYAQAARAIARQMLAHHEDREHGGFFFAPDDGEALIARAKDAYDQAIPSGASMAALLCLRLGELGGEDEARAAGEKQLRLLAKDAVENPLGLGQAALGLDRQVHGATEIVVVGSRAAAEPFVAAAYRVYLPNRALAWVDPADPASVAAAPALAEGKAARGGGAVAYVCRGRACSAPVSDPSELEAMLREGEGRAR